MTKRSEKKTICVLDQTLLLDNVNAKTIYAQVFCIRYFCDILLSAVMLLSMDYLYCYVLL